MNCLGTAVGLRPGQARGIGSVAMNQNIRVSQGAVKFGT